MRIHLNPSSKKQEHNSFFNKANLNIINVNTRGGVIREGWEMVGTVPQTTVTNYTSSEQSQKQCHQTIFTCPNFKNTRSCTLKTQEKKKTKKQLELTLQPFVASRQVSSARFSPYSIHLQLKTFQEP